ncbi:MAG: hypothetical protein KKA79_00745 [Nanoarchaeota archaeon]|nr:hypothetical protein [Nanoarchaeota archaeon]MCG2719004.1 hypothetical protein [Nanoarchaeota archaeon]
MEGTKPKVMESLTEESLEKANNMSVEELTNLFKQDTVEDVELQNKAAETSAASQAFMKSSRSLGKAINGLLMDNENLQKSWTKVIADLGMGKDGSGQGFKYKIVAANIPFMSGWLKKGIEKDIDNKILEVLPELLKQQWSMTEKAARRVEVQKVLLKQSQDEAEKYFQELGQDMIRLRKENRVKKEKFDKAREELENINAQLKENEELETLADEGKDLPDGKIVLDEVAYQNLINRRGKLIDMDNDREVALQTTTQELRASKDGYAMTELQIGELTTTLKAINAISTMLNAFIKVTRPIMMRSIVIINAQRDGIQAANMLYALSESMNSTIKMCAYGMTHMTEQAVMLGNKDFLEKGTIEEVKEIQAANDRVWKDFTKKQYAQVMAKVKPLQELAADVGSTDQQTV